MKSIRFIAALSVLVMSISSCDKAATDEVPSLFDRAKMKSLEVEKGEKASSSVTILFPSGEVHTFAKISYGDSSDGDIANGYGSKSILLSTEIMTLPDKGRQDFLVFTLGYDDPTGKVKRGELLDLKYIHFFWVTSSFSGDDTYRHRGEVRIEDITEDELILLLDNVIFELSDGRYTINGYVSVKR